mgnify:CR=1 FL=1
MNVLVIGGGGYVGSLLVPALLNENFNVKVIDLFMFGEPRIIYGDLLKNENFSVIKADIRDFDILEDIVSNMDAVIHLACISNDPSFELNPELGKSINFDCFLPMVKFCKLKKVKKFIYASSSSVYGIKDNENVTENLSLEPLTDYSKYKVMCENVLLNESNDSMISTVLRPATVCGYSPRTRLDVIVNILTNHAYINNKITIFGGNQKRPNIHIKDMVRAYLLILKEKDKNVNSEIFNVGYENYSLDQLANMVIDTVKKEIILCHKETNDLRSYHVSSEKILKKLNFKPNFTIQNAVEDLCEAFEIGLLPNSIEDPRYYNIKTMQLLNLK